MLPLAHELADRVVDRRDVVGVEGMADAEQIGCQAGADPEGLGAGMPRHDRGEQDRPADDVQKSDRTDDANPAPPGPEHPGDAASQCHSFLSRTAQAIFGTYGKVADGFDVTDSLPMPSPMGAFAAMENMTSGALSVSDRPFHSARPNTAGVPTT